MFIKIIIFILAVSLIANGTFLYKNSPKEKESVSAPEQYPLLSKRIFVENQNNIIINFIPLRTALNEYVEKQEDKVGVYFEYLPSGTSIGVNDKEEVKIVSWSKVPMSMSILKKIERKKLAFDDILTIEEKHLDQKFGTLWKRGAGTKLSVEELLRITLTESDNTAYNVLASQLTDQELNEVYAGLDIPLSQEEKGGEEIHLLVSPKNYSSVFRSLYLSSFLSKEHSSFLLNILTQTKFHDKLAAGVPDTVTVAHKIGVFEPLSSEQDIFTDCGIVYVPERPYVLCMFVRDSNEQAQNHMAYISKMVYEYIRMVKAE